MIYHLLKSEFKRLDSIGSPFDGLSIMKLIETHASITFVKNNVMAYAERIRMLRRNRIEASVPIEISIPVNIWLHILNAVVNNPDSILLQILGFIINDTQILPFFLAPTGLTVDAPEDISIGTVLVVNVDSLRPNTDVTIAFINEDSSTVEDTDTVTTDANGSASTAIVVPTGYAENTIILRISQTIATIVQYNFLSANVEHVEDSIIDIVT